MVQSERYDVRERWLGSFEGQGEGGCDVAALSLWVRTLLSYSVCVCVCVCVCGVG